MLHNSISLFKMVYHNRLCKKAGGSPYSDDTLASGGPYRNSTIAVHNLRTRKDEKHPYSERCISWSCTSPSKQSARLGFMPILCCNCATLGWMDPPPLTSCRPSRTIFSSDITTAWNSSLHSSQNYSNMNQFPHINP